jgi:hypothetical protein
MPYDRRSPHELPALTRPLLLVRSGVLSVSGVYTLQSAVSGSVYRQLAGPVAPGGMRWLQGRSVNGACRLSDFSRAARGPAGWPGFGEGSDEFGVADFQHVHVAALL